MLTDQGWTPSTWISLTVVAQPHRHHASVLGWDADRALLAASGATESSRSPAAAGWPGTSG
ncbi:MAG: hypothetical protein R2734_02820 [Nocardioides sp.]